MMDPSKKIGKMKEQVEMEHASRRNYPVKWGKISQPEINKFYNQNEVNRMIRSDSNQKELCRPYTYTGHGDSYFVSKDMYNSLMAKCRCGRPRTEGHIVKCLQKELNKYLPANCDEANNEKSPIGKRNIKQYSLDSSPGKRDKHSDVSSSGHPSKSIKSQMANNCTTFARIHISETSSGTIGWPRAPRYEKWEQSTKYVSPVVTMPGYRIAEHPYNAIFIG